MAYFDNAATSYPKPNEVYSFMDSFYRNYGGSAGRGNYALANTAKGIIDETRQILKDLMHCPAKQVVFTPTATIALNIVIQGMIKNGARNVYISPFEHNAVTRVLHYYEKAEQINVIELPVTKMLEYDYVRMRYQFDSARPDLVIVSHASNVSGFVSPVEEIFALAKRVRRDYDCRYGTDGRTCRYQCWPRNYRLCCFRRTQNASRAHRHFWLLDESCSRSSTGVVRGNRL